MCEDAQLPEHGQREHRPQERTGQRGDERERREVAEQDVLDHVDGEQVLLAVRVDRRDECDEEQDDRQPEEPCRQPGTGWPRRASVRARHS